MEDNKNGDIHSLDSPPSVLRSSRDEKPLHYTLQIRSFSLLKAALSTSKRDRYESQIFNVGDYKWKLALYPNGDVKRNGSDHISLYLVLAEDALEVNVVFTFLVYNQLKDKYLTVQDGKVRRFHAIKKEWGFEKLVSLETFNDASNGLLVNDCCAIGVDVIVRKCDGNGEVLSLIKEPNNYKFSWEFKNFSQLNLDIYESRSFTVENHGWKIRLHPTGDKSKAASGFVSLYLMLERWKEPPQGFDLYVEFEMAVLSQLGVEPKKITFEHWFSGAASIGLGTSKFMSLSDLKEPTKGFLQDDTLIVEVKINVISTLKKI